MWEMAAHSPPAKKNLQDPGEDFKTIAKKALIAHPRNAPSWIFSTVDIAACSVVGKGVDGGTNELHVCPGSVAFLVKPTVKACRPSS